MIPWTLSEPLLWRPFPWSTTTVQLSRDARECVVNIGYCEVENELRSFRPVATGFLATHWDGSFFTYLVTAKHVVLKIERELDGEFYLRINVPRGEPELMRFQSPDWTFHPDDTVDLAVLEFPTTDATERVPWKDSGLVWGLDGSTRFGPGDLTYTVGLFRVHSGKSRNIPVVHTGNLAAYSPDERVEVEDWDQPNNAAARKLIDAYIVQCATLQGSSGSPVFVRSTSEAAPIQHGHDKRGNIAMGFAPKKPLAYGGVELLGVWRGSWEMPKQDTGGERLPAGFGTVVPSTKLREVMQVKKLSDRRDAANEDRERKKREGKEVPVGDSLQIPDRKAKKRFDATLKKMLDTPPDPRVKSK